MEKTSIILNGKTIYLYTAHGAQFLLVQPVDDHDLSVLDNEVDCLKKSTSAPFSLAAIKIDEWQVELSPWEAPPVFGKDGFGAGAMGTLSFIENDLLPELMARGIYDETSMKCMLGGYSLAGLFALWAGYNSGAFDGVAAVSPSVWFPRWVDYSMRNKIKVPAVYLSLGDKEEKVRNQVMARVGNALRQTAMLLEEHGVKTILEWNQGNHFQQPDVRTASGFAWLLKS